MLAVLVTSLSILVPTLAVGAKTGSYNSNTNPKARLAYLPTAIDPVKRLKQLEERARARAAHRHDARVRKYIRQWRKEQARKRAEARRRAEALAAAQAASQSPAGSGAVGTGTAPTSALQSIAQCESGGDPTAIGGGGTYRGKYQFTYSTWASVGGSGDPAAASEAEQDRRAAILYNTAGAGQWPVCGR